MKKLLLVLMTMTATVALCQSLPIDFETAIMSEDFIDFDGGTATVIDNPQSNGINTSDKVGQMIRNGGEIWSGSKIQLAANLDFSANSSMSMKVYTTAPVGTVVKFKLEGEGATERDAITTVTGEWEELTWDFTGTPMLYDEVVFMFDFGNVGDGSETSTFLFDDVEQVFAGSQLDLPVDFEGADVNYEMTDFGGNFSMLVSDPTDASNSVMQVTKPVGAAEWAGTTIGTPGGFANYIPLNSANSFMVMRVWSPAAGIPVRLKVEDANDPTHTCETEVVTTVAGGWQYLEFNFANEAPGTAALADGLAMGWQYNMASVFFNFGTNGDTAGEQTYFFDDVEFGALIIATDDVAGEAIRAYPNPTGTGWSIGLPGMAISQVKLLDAQGRHLLTAATQAEELYIDGASLPSGVYYGVVTSTAGSHSIRLVKE